MMVKTRFTPHPQAHFYCNLIKPEILTGPWIAGGAVLKWIKGEYVQSDVDVFFSSRMQFDIVLDMLKCRGYSVSFNSDNAVTLSSFSVPKVQLIKRVHSSCEDLFSTFDITVCQFATDGKVVVSTQEAIDHLNSRTLHFRNVKKSSLQRLLKYQSYGFTPDEDTIRLFDENYDNIVFENVCGVGDEY